jgi:hypothetical protein
LIDKEKYILCRRKEKESSWYFLYISTENEPDPFLKAQMRE